MGKKKFTGINGHNMAWVESGMEVILLFSCMETQHRLIYGATLYLILKHLVVVSHLTLSEWETQIS